MLPIALMFLFASCVFGVDVKLVEQFHFAEKNVLSFEPKSFLVLEDKFVIIPDDTKGNIKIFKIGADLLELKSIGKKGFEKGQFRKPMFCHYDRSEGILGILDNQRRFIIIYKRKAIDSLEFEFFQEFRCFLGGTDLYLKDGMVFISGFTDKGNDECYDLYSIDLKKRDIAYLLPSYLKYGLKSYPEYYQMYRKEKKIIAVGIRGWFDIEGDYAYYVWEGDRKIIPVKITNSIVESSFGKLPNDYKKPIASKRILELRKNRDPVGLRIEKQKMTFVRNIFVNSRYIFVIYEGPNIEGKSNIKVQFYTLERKYLGEVLIPDKPSRLVFFNEDDNIFYSLDTNSDRSSLLKYEIKLKKSSNLEGDIP